MKKKERETLQNIITASIMEGKMVRDFEDHHYKKYIVTGPQQGNSLVEREIGKVIQVRKEAGDFGSDIVFIRHPGGSLWTHANQMFWLVPEAFYPELDAFYEKDSDDITNSYSINNENEKTGFIIPSIIPEGESTPLRDIRQKIKQALFPTS